MRLLTTFFTHLFCKNGETQYSTQIVGQKNVVICSILALQVDWPIGKRLPGFHQSLDFALPCNFLEFWHFKQRISKKFYIFKNNLINAELAKGTTIIRWWIEQPKYSARLLFHSCKVSPLSLSLSEGRKSKHKHWVKQYLHKKIGLFLNL